MKKQLNRKGTFIVSAFAFFMVSLVFCTFAWDTSRLLYYKIHNQNLASTIAISIVNESSHYESDSVGKKAKGYLVTRYHTQGIKPKGFNGRFADDTSLINYIKSLNVMSGGDFRVTDVNVNSYLQDKRRFIIGSDGVNGEIRVVTTMEVDLFFSKVGTMFGMSQSSSKKVIKNIAVAQPIYKGTGSIKIDWDKQQIFDHYVPI